MLRLSGSCWQWLRFCVRAFLILTVTRIKSATSTTNPAGVSLSPPRGWNSYDSYSWIVSEEEFLNNAQKVSERLLPFGYEYVVVDFLWYRRHVEGASVLSPGFDVIDEWGRPIPDPGRWPSSKDGKGFAPVAEKVHAMGLKFGIHVMRGISSAAVKANSTILQDKGRSGGSEGREWTAREIFVTGTDCGWMQGCFFGVNVSTEGGLAFINSLYQQYASWGVDFIKHDCIFGDDYRFDEIAAVSQAIVETGRPMVYSLSPGTRASPDLAWTISNITNMYRVTSDDWDIWPHLESHFNVARDFAAAGLIGASGLHGGKSWPDLDMLPLGQLTDPGADAGPHRSTSLTRDEQITQISLWAMARSPLMFGGDMLSLDQWTLEILTNPVMLEINANSSENRELFSSTSGRTVLQLAACQLTGETSWARSKSNFVVEEDQVCWNSPSSEKILLGCLNWRPSVSNPPATTSAQPSAVNTSYILEVGDIWPSGDPDLCLDAGAMTEHGPTAQFSHGPLTKCVDKPSQTWQVRGKQLVNPASGSCAMVARQEEEYRVWVARGSQGEMIVAFFNIGPSTSLITLALKDIIQNFHSPEPPANPSKFTLTATPSEWQCEVKDGWTGDHNIVRRYLSAAVPSHGAVVSILVACEEVDIGGRMLVDLGIIIVTIMAASALLVTGWLVCKSPYGAAGFQKLSTMELRSGGHRSSAAVRGAGADP